HQQDTIYTNQTRIIVLPLDDLSVGLIVEAANDVIDIDYEELKPPPEVVGSIVDDFINGLIRMDKRWLIILNTKKVLNKEDVNEFKILEGLKYERTKVIPLGTRCIKRKWTYWSRKCNDISIGTNQ